MYEVLTFHLGNVSTVRFFFPPVVHRWTFPCCRPIWSPAPRALWKRAMNSGKVGEPLGGRDFFYRWSWFIYVDFDFAQKQLVGVGFSISDGTMLKGPILYKNLSAAWIITSFMCTGEVDPAMPGSTGVTFTATDITGLILLVKDNSAGWSTPRLLCSRDLFQPQHPWRLLGWLLVIVDHRPTGTAVACFVRGFISKSCCWQRDFLHWEWHHEDRQLYFLGSKLPLFSCGMDGHQPYSRGLHLPIIRTPYSKVGWHDHPQ